MVRLCAKAGTFSVFQRTQSEFGLCGNMIEISGTGVFGDVGLALNTHQVIT